MLGLTMKMVGKDTVRAVILVLLILFSKVIEVGVGGVDGIT